MRVIGRLLVALAVLFPVSIALAAGASGDTGTGPAVLKCMHWKDTMSVSPGIGNNPARQSVDAHGRVYGCNKAGGGAQYSATLQMSGATCSNLAMSGTASFDWANGSHSTAFLLFHPQALEANKVFVDGTITSGMFQGLIVSAWLRFTQVFDGNGVNCSPSNLLQQITFTNSQSFQLLTPTVTTTTQSVGPTTSPPTTSPITPTTAPPTVPVTNQGDPTTAAPTTAAPVTIVLQGGGGPGPGAGGGGVTPQSFPSGTLAFTGSSGLAAMFGFEALLVGGALACLDPERRRRRFARFARMRRPKSFLQVTLPPR